MTEPQRTNPGLQLLFLVLGISSFVIGLIWATMAVLSLVTGDSGGGLSPWFTAPMSVLFILLGVGQLVTWRKGFGWARRRRPTLDQDEAGAK
jgi:hypothetical protein